MPISFDSLAQFLIVAAMVAAVVMPVRSALKRKRLNAKILPLLDEMPFDTMSEEAKAYRLGELSAQEQFTDAQRAATYGGAHGGLR